MVILHKDGVMIELAALEKIRPHSINITNGKRIVEIRFLSGERETYEDSWITKTGEDQSIFDIMLSEKVNWRKVILM